LPSLSFPLLISTFPCRCSQILSIFHFFPRLL
jgi:hypothetical protein